MIIWRPSRRGICSTLASGVELGLDLLQDLEAELLVHHLAAAEAHGHLDLVAFLEEPRHGAHLDVVVVVVDARAAA